MGVPVVFAGLFLLSLAGWLAWGQWVSVAKWPRTNAVLVSKGISSVGARLVFKYDIGGRRITGLGFRWGSDNAVRNDLRTYEPGTIQRISYDPDDPSQVETILGYSWDLFRAPIAAAAFGVLFVAGGAVVYRWSYGWGSHKV